MFGCITNYTLYDKRVWFSRAASRHRPHFPYSSPPSHHSHVTQYNPYFYLYLYIFPTQVHHRLNIGSHSITHICICISICICTFSLPKSTILHHSHVISQHHTFSITQESLCLYLYLHLYTFITKIQNHTVPVTSFPAKPQPLSVRTGHPHFHPI